MVDHQNCALQEVCQVRTNIDCQEVNDPMLKSELRLDRYRC